MLAKLGNDMAESNLMQQQQMMAELQNDEDIKGRPSLSGILSGQ